MRVTRRRLRLLLLNIRCVCVVVPVMHPVLKGGALKWFGAGVGCAPPRRAWRLASLAPVDMSAVPAIVVLGGAVRRGAGGGAGAPKVRQWGIACPSRVLSPRQHRLPTYQGERFIRPLLGSRCSGRRLGISS